MKIKHLLKVGALVGLSATLVACSSKPSTSAATSSAPKTDKINVIVTTAPVGMQPLKTNDSASQYINNQIYETLYRRSMDGQSYEPLLAESLPELSDDGLTATIKLRKNVTFSDGTPFDASAVTYMIDALKNKDYGSQRPSIVATIESYTVVDDHTLQLHLAYPDGVLLAKLSHTNGAIVNPKLDPQQDFLVDPTGAGTGPYKYVSSVTGSSYDLVENENYWGTKPEVKSVHFDVVADESTAISRLQTGEADFYPTVSADSLPVVQGIANYTTKNQESSAVQYVMLRNSDVTATNPLMANLEFRKAILQSIDIPTYVDTVLAGAATSVKSIVLPSLVGYTSAMDDAYIGYDVEKAKATIEKNGWTGQKVTILVPTRPAQQTFAAYAQDALSKVGLQAEIVAQEWATFLSTAKEDKAFDLSVMGWSNVTGDGQQMLEPNFSTTNGVRLKYNNAEFDGYVDESAKTTDLKQRQEAMLKAVKKIQGDAVVTPLYASNSMICYSNKFDNIDVGMGNEFYIGTFKVK